MSAAPTEGCESTIPAPAQPHWHSDMREVIRFARVLEDCAAIVNVIEAIDYFERPWSWRDEYRRWVALGRPSRVMCFEDLEGPLYVVTSIGVASHAEYRYPTREQADVAANALTTAGFQVVVTEEP